MTMVVEFQYWVQIRLKSLFIYVITAIKKKKHPNIKMQLSDWTSLKFESIFLCADIETKVLFTAGFKRQNFWPSPLRLVKNCVESISH